MAYAAMSTDSARACGPELARQARQATAEWVRGGPGEDELTVLTQWHAFLKDLVSQANKVGVVRHSVSQAFKPCEAGSSLWVRWFGVKQCTSDVI